MGNTKIRQTEAIFLILSIIINHTILNLPKYLVDTSKSSTIINLIYISIIAILLTMVICRLLRKFSGLDILDISNYLGGKALKNIIGSLFIIYFVITSATLLRSFCNNLQILYYPMTSIVFILLLFIITLIINTHLNFSSIIKCNLFIVPAVIFGIVFIVIANSKYIELERIFPILGTGFGNTFFYGISNLFAFSGISYLYFIPPTLKESNQFKKIAIISIAISAIYLILSVSVIFFIFNSFSEIDEILPLFNAVRYIEFGTFFQRLDSIFLLAWIISFVCYLGIISNFALNIFKKITNIKNEKAISYSMFFLILAISLLFTDISIVQFFESTICKYMFFGIVIFTSLSILIFANFKKLKHKEGESHVKQS